MLDHDGSSRRPALLDQLRTTVRGYMLRGVVILVPLGVTALVLGFIYDLTAGQIAPYIQNHLLPMPGYAVVALSLILFLALLYGIGLATAMVVGKRAIVIGESILQRIPLVKTVYAASKQVVDVVSLQNAEASYQAAAIVGFPSPRIKAIAFITGKLHIEGEGDFYRLFVPTTPNPTSGYFEIMQPNLVQHTTLTVEDAVKAVMSAGILTPEKFEFVEARSEQTSSNAIAGHDADAIVKSKPQPPSEGRPHRGAQSFWGRVTHLLRTRLLSGFLVLVPAGITAFILSFIYNLTAGRIAPITAKLTGTLPGFVTVILATALLLVLLYVTGYVATAVLGRRIIHLIERVIDRIPFVTTVYGASKQIAETLLQTGGEPKLQAPVLVEFPYPGARTIGFVVGKITSGDGREYFKVFVPTTPNITVGLLEMYEADSVHSCGLSVEDAVKMVVSGGIIGPASIRLVPITSEEVR